MKVKTYKLYVVCSLVALLAAYTNCGNPFQQPSPLFFESNIYGGPLSVSHRAFEETVYAITRANCVSCHATQQPMHAADNVVTAHDAVITGFKVNFSNIENSRLVKKLRDDNHNCWGDCEENANEMAQAISDWNDAIKNSGAPQPPVDLAHYTEEILLSEAFNGAAIVTLRYDVSEIVRVPGVEFRVDISEYDSFSYQLTNPRISTSSVDIRAKNIKVLVNGQYNPQHSTYTIIDQIATPQNGQLSTYSMVVLKEDGPLEDKISFSFEVLKVDEGINDLDEEDLTVSLATFEDTVYPVTRMYCINCHTDQEPPHASNNIAVAHDVVLTQSLVNFNVPANSRLVEKVRGRHNCGSQTQCNNIADQFQAAIEEWKQRRP